MNHSFLSRQSHLRRRAAALVIVLGVVVILAVLVVALTVAMRLERQAAHYYSERARADLLARAGIDCVKAALLEAASTNHVWISMPGRILFTSGEAGNFSNATVYNLYSGDATASAFSSTDLLAPPDLNRPVLSDDKTNAIDPSSGVVMPVSWIYLRKDGTYDTNASPAFDAANPVIGRFAYWADDESARINLNTAWSQTNSTNVSAGFPSRVDLTAIPNLTASNASLIYNQALLKSYQSPDEARRLDAGLAKVLSDNRFFTTHYSQSDNLNPWGNSKIYLTTQISNLPPGFTNIPGYTNYFIDILNAPNTDPALSASLNANKYIAQLGRIQQLLQRTDWPYASGSFSGKYGVTNSLQLALNIIDYVRAAESTNSVMHKVFVDPFGPGGTTNTSISGGVDLKRLSILAGTTRAPCLTEIGVHLGNPKIEGSAVWWPVTCKAAYYFPPKYGLDAGTFLQGKYLAAHVGWEDSGTFVRDTVNGVLAATNIDTSKPNFGIVTFQQGMRTTTNNTSLTNRPTEAYVRVGLLPTQGGGQTEIIEIAAIPLIAGLTVPANVSTLKNATIRVAIDPNTVPASAITSVKANDPRVNKYSTNWSAPSAATWGSLPSPQAVTPSPVPPQDTDSGGGISAYSLAMPAPKGATNNPLGAVSSVAELGYLSTGVSANVPWRTLRLQPNPDPSSLPDWALADLFATPIMPNTSQTSVIFPQPNSVAGRINLNAEVQPFTNVSRQIALRALFGDPTSATAITVSSNIANRTLAAGGHMYGSSNAYDSIGELAEIQGVASDGEESEQTMREMVDLASVRGNVFRVYSVGQALQQYPSAGGAPFSIQAEKRIMALIERLPDGRLNVIYWRVIPL